MKPAPFSQKELDRDRAKADCIKYGAPTLSVDHSTHYKRIEVLMGIEPDEEKDNDL